MCTSFKLLEVTTQLQRDSFIPGLFLFFHQLAFCFKTNYLNKSSTYSGQDWELKLFLGENCQQLGCGSAVLKSPPYWTFFILNLLSWFIQSKGGYIKRDDIFGITLWKTLFLFFVFLFVTKNKPRNSPGPRHLILFGICLRSI